jgi:putative Flp pilus-assembly TadE/G-like protein
MDSASKKDKVQPSKRQQGQAMVFVVVFIGMVLLALVFLFRAGMITSEKMRVQNAADAAAYSVAIIEARDLNFISYMNRAMVANEVAIAQSIGLLSWAHNWKSYGHYLMAYHDNFIRPMVAALTIGSSPDTLRGGFLLASNGAFIKPGGILTDFLKPAGNVFATAAHVSNQILGQTTRAFHTANFLYALSTIQPVMDQNAPGSALSGYGFLSLLAHLETFGSMNFPPLNKDGSFTRTYLPTSSAAIDVTGFERFAAVVRQSRDEFSKERGWTIPLAIPPILPLDIDEGVSFGSAGIGFSLDFKLKLSFDLNRKGGGELVKTGAGKGDEYAWASGDTTGLEINFYFHLGAELTLGPFTVGGKATFSLGNNETCGTLVITIPIPDFLGGPLDITIVDTCFGMPTSAPFSSGSAQIADGNTLSTSDIEGVDYASYGEAPNTTIAWGSQVGPFIPSGGPDSLYSPTVPVGTVPVTAMTIVKKEHQLEIPSIPVIKPGKGYKGLPIYVDTMFDVNHPNFDPTQDYPIPPTYGAGAGGVLYGFKAPYFIAGIEQDVGNLFSNNFVQPTGMFDLTDQTASDKVAAIAKAEVYYSRPNDLAYFQRTDNLTEYGSTFNPYWQARLAPLTYADRTVAAWVDQGQALGNIAGGTQPNLTTVGVLTSILSSAGTPIAVTPVP